MTFAFEETRDGYLVRDAAGVPLCRIETKTIERVQETQPPDNRVVWIERAAALPLARWQIRFCGRTLTPQDLATLQAEMPKG